MPDKRELRVRKMDARSVREGVDGVYLECDGVRCGDFEPWVVEWLKDGIYPSGVPKNHMETLKQYDRRLDLTVGFAIARVLQEAADE